MLHGCHQQLRAHPHFCAMELERYAFRVSCRNAVGGEDTHQLLYYPRRGGAEVEVRRRLARSAAPAALALARVVPGARLTLAGIVYTVRGYADAGTAAALSPRDAAAALVLPCGGAEEEEAEGAADADADAGLRAAAGQWAAAEEAGLRVAGARLLSGDAAAAAAAAAADGQQTPRPAPQRALLLDVRGADVARELARVVGCGGAWVCAAPSAAALAPARLVPPSVGFPMPSGPVEDAGRCACMVILPHVVWAGRAGHALQDALAAVASGVDEPLRVSTLGMADLEREQAEAFLEAYRDVLPAWSAAVAMWCAGTVVAVCVRGPRAVSRLRALAGPRDVDAARRLAPDTLRARYGKDEAEPGVLVTDLEEDGPLEAAWLFGAAGA